MNSIPGREPRPDKSRYQSTQRNPQRGCYLALTFGTLLSSQGADAQQLDPRGLRRWRIVQPYAATSCSHSGIIRLDLSAPRGASRTIHEFAGPCTGGPRSPVAAGDGPGSEAEEALDPDGEPWVPADLADCQEHPGHEGGAVVRVVPEGQRLPRRPHQDLLVRDEAGEPDGVHRDALDVRSPGSRQRVRGRVGRRGQPGCPAGSGD